MFNLSKIFGKETPAKPESKEELSYSAVVEGKKPFDPQAVTFNFTEQEIEKFK